MIRDLLRAAPFLLFVACRSLPAPTAAPLLSIIHEDGGAWPRITTTKIYPDGTLELSDSGGIIRTRIGENDARFRTLIETMGTASFAADLTTASVPTIEWKSTGEWIRIERKDVISRVKPPNITTRLCVSIRTVDALFKHAFKRRYKPMLSPHDCDAAVMAPPNSATVH
jgi:hypothetical protein